MAVCFYSSLSSREQASSEEYCAKHLRSLLLAITGVQVRVHCSLITHVLRIHPTELLKV